jgi:hypothetical protein
MTVGELIKKLSKFDPSLEVRTGYLFVSEITEVKKGILQKLGGGPTIEFCQLWIPQKDTKK